MDQTVLQILINAKDEASSALKGIGINAKELGIGMAAVGTAITGALALTVSAAADAEKKMASVNAVLDTMGPKGAAAHDAILKAADATLKLGFDNEEAALSISKLFQRTGDLTTATKLNAVAMDLARAKNIDLSTASSLVGMVMSGNARVLKQYGIDLKEAGTPLEALGELQNKVGGQAKAFASTYAGANEVVKQQIGELEEKVGGLLLPVLTKLTSALVPIIEKIMDWMAQNPKLSETIVTIAAVLGPLLVVLPLLVAAIAAIASPVGLVIAGFGLLIAAGVAVYENWDLIKAKAIEIWGKIKDFFMKVLDGIKLYFGIWIDFLTGNWAGAWDKMQQVVELMGPSVQNAMQAVWAGITSKAQAAWDGLKNIVLSSVNWVIDKANGMIASINSAAQSAASKVGLSAPQIPAIPHLAAGGIVTRPTIALIGEAGPEAIVPLSQGNRQFGNVTINITGNSILAADADGVAKKIGDLIMRRTQLSARF